jgi:hypothetical protein
MYSNGRPLEEEKEEEIIPLLTPVSSGSDYTIG